MRATVGEMITHAAALLANDTAARLTVEVLLAHVLKVERSYLYAHPERVLDPAEREVYASLIARRRDGEPLAYLTGRVAFYSLDIEVTPDTLIPRADTETLVEQAQRVMDAWVQAPGVASKQPLRLADLGTGSGAIALALAKANPTWEISATDKSAKALAVAERNAKQQKITNIAFYHGDWLTALPEARFAVIVSNPPYVALRDPHLDPRVPRFEPHEALFADEEGGFCHLYHLSAASRFYLLPQGYLLLEHGFQQGALLRQRLSADGYQDVITCNDLNGLERVTQGQFVGYML